jgi:hypothetical protein
LSRIRARRQHPAHHEKLTVAEVFAELEIARSTFYDWHAKKQEPRCITLANRELLICRSEPDRRLNRALAPAECFRARVMTAAPQGEAFDVTTRTPRLMEAKDNGGPDRPAHRPH